MTDLFSPRRADGRSEWRVIYDATAHRPYGSDLTFEEVEGLLEDGDRARAHRAVRRCNQQFIREALPRVLGNVRGAGYRILKPAEYAPAALAYQVSARKKMTTAVDLMRTAPMTDMTPAQQDWAHKVYLVLCDNELRLRTQERWRSEAERRLTELERRAGVLPVITIEATGTSEAS
jgi:hypothetical protein